MYCAKCGYPMEENATVCSNCGWSVENTSKQVCGYPVYDTLKKADSLGIASIVLGAIGLVAAWLIALLGYIFGGVALGLAFSSLKKDKTCVKAKVGIVLGIITLVFAVINSILGVLIQLGIIGV